MFSSAPAVLYAQTSFMGHRKTDIFLDSQARQNPSREVR
jgi:hypothetical protein